MLDQFLINRELAPSEAFSLDEFTTRETYTSVDNENVSITLSFQSFCKDNNFETTTLSEDTATPSPSVRDDSLGSTTISVVVAVAAFILLLIAVLVCVFVGWCFTMRKRSMKERAMIANSQKSPSELESSGSDLIPREDGIGNAKNGNVGKVDKGQRGNDRGETKRGKTSSTAELDKKKQYEEKGKGKESLSPPTSTTAAATTTTGVDSGGRERKKMDKKARSAISVQAFVDKIESGDGDKTKTTPPPKKPKQQRHGRRQRQEEPSYPAPPAFSLRRVQRTIRNKVSSIRNAFSSEIYDEPIRPKSQLVETGIELNPNVGYGMLEHGSSPSSQKENSEKLVVVDVEDNRGANTQRMSIEVPIGSDGYADPVQVNTISRNSALIVPEGDIVVHPNIGYSTPSVTKLDEETGGEDKSGEDYDYVQVD